MEELNLCKRCLSVVLFVDVFKNLCLLVCAELWQMNRTWVFQGHAGPLQPQTMQLDESHQRLYVGAKNALFSLSLDRVNSHHRQVCLASLYSFLF